MMNLAQMAQTLGTAAADSHASLSLVAGANGRYIVQATWTRPGRAMQGYNYAVPLLPHDATLDDWIDRAFRVILHEVHTS